MSHEAKLARCVGCRDDFYNDKNQLGVKQCCHFASAKSVTRYRIGWWTAPDSAECFRKVETNSCYHAPGTSQDFEQLPDHLRASARTPEQRPCD